jgi:hypothetical protein
VDVRRGATWCEEACLDVRPYIFFGFLGETRRDKRDTVDFALGLQRNYDVHLGFFVATRLPGTMVEKSFFERGTHEGSANARCAVEDDLGASVLDGGTFTTNDVREMRETFLYKYFTGRRGRTAAR